MDRSPDSGLFSDLPADELPFIMGILNVTPDSFYDGGKYERLQDARDRAFSMRDEGADLVDVGGESTRPGAQSVSTQEEIDRVVPVIRTLRDENFKLPISVDTSKARVAEAALDAGANWVNDVTALQGDPEMPSLLADREAGVVLMHMQGSPRTMQEDPRYGDVIGDLRDFFKRRVETAVMAGIPRDRLLIDPGIGFGKTLEHNRRLLSEVSRFGRLGLPILVGHSRKSFLDGLLGRPAEERKSGTLAVSSHLMGECVHVLRVHDVRAHVDLRAVLKWLELGVHPDSTFSS